MKSSLVLMHRRSSSLSPLATDPTFTLANVTTAVEIVDNWGRLYYLGVPGKKRGSKEEMLQYFITTVPNASWETLAGGLYYAQEHAALANVSKQFQSQPGVGSWGLMSIWCSDLRDTRNNLLTLRPELDLLLDCSLDVLCVLICMCCVL